ncbi:MAG: hypothetical protein NWP87_06060, partial [Winogradskyella sp.]|nr:hypothetical protein [Winogradskyella sp.]
MSKVNYILFSFLFASTFLLAQKTSFQSIRFNQLKSDHGLSNDWVNTIAEDTNGYMWVGTRHGLNIFDGSTISQFKSNKDFSSLDISYIHYSQSNKMLVGTWGGGLYVINPYSKEVTNENNSLFEKNLVIKSIIEKSDSSIWLATFGQGLVRYSIKDNSYKTYKDFDFTSPKESFKYVEGLTYLENTLWLINTTGQLGYLSPTSDNLCLFKNKDGSAYNLGSDITSIINFKNKLILGTRNGTIFSLHFENNSWITEKIISVSEENNVKYRIKSFQISKDNLWISTTNNLYRFNFLDKVLEEHRSPVFNLEYKSIIQTFVDSRNILWCATWGQGLLYKSNQSNIFSELPLKLPNDYAISDIVIFDKENYLIGTDKGLFIYSKQKHSLKEFSVRLNNDILQEINVNCLVRFKDRFIINLYDIGLFYLNKNGSLEAIDGAPNFQ